MSEARFVTTVRLSVAAREKITAAEVPVTKFIQEAIERYCFADLLCVHADDPAREHLLALAKARGWTVTLCGVDPTKVKLS